MFQIYTQFGFLFLGYVYIRGFTMDSKNGTFPFVQQIGYSFRAIMGMKSVIYIVTTIVYMDIVTVTYAMIAGIQDLDYILLMIIPLDLGIITLILFDLLISVIFMQVSLAYVIHILIFFYPVNLRALPDKSGMHFQRISDNCKLYLQISLPYPALVFYEFYLRKMAG